MISVKVNGVITEVPPGTSILDACRGVGVFVPTLCHHPDLPPAGKCGICVVKVNGTQFSLSCSTKVQPGMVIDTNSPDVKSKALQAFQAFDDMPQMPACKEIEEIVEYLTQKKLKRSRLAEHTHSIAFDPTKCINCGRCERQCSEGQAIGALDAGSKSLRDGECISCGQCVTVCPTAAISEFSSIPQVMRALAAGKTLVFQSAPATRVSAGELFGDPVGTVVTGKLVTAARRLGFKYVFDTNWAADMTIWEEGTELIERVSHNGVLPMFTSCCPAWINFVEKIHPELIPNLSTAKSPHMMLGACVKSYFAERRGIDPKDLFVVSLMPCTAKKDEIQRPQMLGDVDAVLTVREFCRMIEMFGLDWKNLPNDTFDRLLGESTGAAALFGVTGGVMEAAVRFAHEKLTGEKLGKVDYQQWRGFRTMKTATVRIADVELRIAVCNGISTARELVESGEYRNYHFIEVMSCPFGCIGGGGQPLLPTRKQAAKRAQAIYEIDHQMTGKVTSFDNTEISEIYRNFMGEPNGERAHRLLHTHYQAQITPALELKKTMEKLPIVAYGSASGNAAKLARQIAGYIGTAPISLNACGLQKMLKKHTAIIVLSTFGDGEVPTNAIKFVEQLEANTESLGELRYAICALGSHEYPKFVAAARRVDTLLGRMNAQRLLPTVEIDAGAPDKGEGVFEAWAPKVVTSLGLKMPEIKIVPQYTITTVTGDDPVISEPLVPLGFGWGVLVSSTVLTPDGFEPQMHRYSIKLPRGMTYAPGDHVGILPQNDEAVVKAVLAQLNLDPGVVLDVRTELPEGINTIPSKVTVKQLFSQYLDLNGLPTRNLIRVFRQFCRDPFTEGQLAKLLDPAEPRFFDDMMSDTTIGEFIQEHAPHGAPPLEYLVSACPLMKPRLYSIASAPSGAGRNIDLVITDNYFGPHNARRGLCTSFLRRFGLTRVALRTQPGCFGYPEDPSTPILMAALGCGVAPMLSLLQHRENLAGEIGSAALFFGCRFKNTYPILDSILQNYVETGAMQDLYIAYSREGNSKTYITDLMRNNTDDVWKYWSNPKCEYFYCGPARGIPDQLDAILIQITMEKGHMSREEAEAFCNAHPHHIESF